MMSRTRVNMSPPRTSPHKGEGGVNVSKSPSPFGGAARGGGSVTKTGPRLPGFAR